MPKLEKHIIIPHKPDQVFGLVADISRYPEFIRWIQSMSVTGERSDAVGDHCVGNAVVGFKGFHERFSTLVSANKAANRITVRLERGPFRHLDNRWTFTETRQGTTRVDFFIDYEFKNPILGMLAKMNTSIAVNKIMQAFMDEADRRFGAPQASLI